LPKKPSSIQSTGKIPNIPLISRDINDKQLVKPMVADALESQQSSRQDDNPFSVDQLSAVWKSFIELLKNEDKASELSVVNQPYEVRDGTTIIIQLANSLQEDILERFRTRFVRYLRHELSNQKITIATELVQETVKQRLYTSQDKFNYLVRKNPKLLDLRQRLDLDYDY
jgi:DNA polymerase III subunit gamma/tau